jgi:hypothetical protein
MNFRTPLLCRRLWMRTLWMIAFADYVASASWESSALRDAKCAPAGACQLASRPASAALLIGDNQSIHSGWPTLRSPS